MSDLSGDLKARKIGGVGSEGLGCPLQRTYSLALTRADLQTYRSSNFNSCSNRRDGPALRTKRTFECKASSPDLQLSPANLQRGFANLRVLQNKKFFEHNRRRRLADLHKKKVLGEASCPLCGENSRGSKLKELRDRLAPNRVL